jgi:hypothetical protein
MAIEATSHAADRTKEVAAYRIQQADFISPIHVSTGEDGVESQFELSPWYNNKGSSASAEFSLCTLEQDDWVENCRGTIQIDYKDCGSTQDLPASEILGVQHPTRCLNENKVYKSFDSMGLTFGPTFRSLSNVVVSSDLRARSVIKAFDPEANNSGYNQNHVIHPITLDGIFQTILVALTQSTKKKFPTAVPTKIDNLWISGEGAACRTVSDLHFSATIEEQSIRKTASSAQAHDGEGNIRVSIARLQTTFVDSVSDDS